MRRGCEAGWRSRTTTVERRCITLITLAAIDSLHCTRFSFIPFVSAFLSLFSRFVDSSRSLV